MALSDYKKEDLLDNEIRASRIKNNLLDWEMNYNIKYNNIKYMPNVAKKIREHKPSRYYIMSRTPEKNEYWGYVIAKHLINVGIAPSKVCITNLEDCYLSVRGFGDMAKIKDKIFANDNELIIIEGVREMRMTDIKDNVSSFWDEFWAYCAKNKKLNVLLLFDYQVTKEEKENWDLKFEKETKIRKKYKNDTHKMSEVLTKFRETYGRAGSDWYPRRSEKSPHKDLGFEML